MIVRHSYLICSYERYATDYNPCSPSPTLQLLWDVQYGSINSEHCSLLQHSIPSASLMVSLNIRYQTPTQGRAFNLFGVYRYSSTVLRYVTPDYFV